MLWTMWQKPVGLPRHHLPILPWQDRVDCQASRRDKGLRSRCTVFSQHHRGQVVMQRCCWILTQLEAPVSSGHYLETSSNFRMHAKDLPEARRAFHQCHEGSFIPRLHTPSCHLRRETRQGGSCLKAQTGYIIFWALCKREMQALCSKANDFRTVMCSVVSGSVTLWAVATPWTAAWVCPWDFPGKNTQAGYQLPLQGSSRLRNWAGVSVSPALGGRFSTTVPLGKPKIMMAEP